ncbi:MAG TPA: YoaK family protein, partial [Gaiellaceae bacterium]
MSAWSGVVGTLRPRASVKEDGLPPLLIALTVVTGVVDALAYLRLGHVFVANMTGNVVFLGFAAGGAGGLSFWGSLLALACFLPGGIAAGRLASRLGDDRRRQLFAAATVELALCLIAVAVAAVAGRD